MSASMATQKWLVGCRYSVDLTLSSGHADKLAIVYPCGVHPVALLTVYMCVCDPQSQLTASLLLNFFTTCNIVCKFVYCILGYPNIFQKYII
jgi:hypothetical protein